ncbi:MAG: IS1380 family transposase, partial [Gammaproteobacteria bacterium]
LEAKRKGCEALAGKSTLNRLELYPRAGLSPYHKIVPDTEALERLFVELFLDSYARAPKKIVLDLDATDVALHGEQESRFFHGYYDHYCYLPLYIYCGRQLLCAKLRPANIDGAAGAVDELQRIIGQIRKRWPKTRIILRADSGFARDALMSWCEEHCIDYVFGLAKNARLKRVITAELAEAQALCAASGHSRRLFKEIIYCTRKSWGCRRRVVAKAEATPLGPNPRFIVTSLSVKEYPARALYEDLYCARGEAENRIKECQLDLFGDRLSGGLLRTNQLRLWFASFAYVLMASLRRLALSSTIFARASVGTIRLKLLKIGATVKSSVRRVKLGMNSAHPHQKEFHAAFDALSAAAR